MRQPRRVLRPSILLVPAAVCLVGCELLSGVNDLEKDPNFDPDAQTSVPVDTGTSPVDTAVADTAVAETAVPDTAVAETATDSGGCTEAESKTLAGHCYFPIKTNFTYDAAQAACVAKGAHLATVTSDAEQTLVATIDAAAERWIGLKGTGPTKAGFAWVTGETSTYDAWATGEPNVTGEACARIKVPDHKWYDTTCTTATFHALCERD
jgi:hypothetical protein